MFRLCFIVASFLCVLCFGQTLKKNISDVTGRINPYTIAYDGNYYYMSAAGKPEKIYKVDVSTGNLVAESPTPLADFRTLVYLWTTSQLIGKTADSGNNSSGHGVYVIDRNTLTLGNRISNVVIGIPDSALSYSSFSNSWGWWNTSVPKDPPLLNYKFQTNAKTVTYPFPSNTPLQGVTLDTRLHMNVASNPSWIYYASQTFYIGSGNTNTPLQSNDFPNVNGSNFLGYTEDGLAWLYDESDGVWSGFFINEIPSCTDPFNYFSANDQISDCTTLLPSTYPQTCYGTYAYFNYSDSSSSFSCLANKRDLILTRYWMIWDLWNNTEYINQTVTVTLPSPLSSLAPSNPVVQSCGTNQPFGGDSLETISSLYACTGPVSYVDFVIQHGCPNNYTLVRQWTHVDCTGITIYNQTAEYRDKQAPIISTAPNITVNYGQSVPPPEATDNCTTNFTISYIDTPLSEGGCSNDSLVYRIWTISDSCNNATMPQFITFRPPLVYIPIDVTVECNNSAPPHPDVTGWAMSSIGNYTATWSDSIVYVNNDCNPQNPLYLYVARTWTVVDKCGRRTGVQHITLDDSQAPNLQIPDDVEESCTSSTSPSLTGYANATDMCIGNLNVSYSDTTTFSSICNQDLNIIRTWTATDKCGHTVSLEQSISQSDTIAPYFVHPPINRVIEVAKEVKITCDASKLIAMLGVFQANVTLKDNCDPAPTHKITTDWSCGSLILTWTLSDACGNTNTSLQNITESVQSPNEGFTLVYPSFMLLALLFGGRMFF